MLNLPICLSLFQQEIITTPCLLIELLLLVQGLYGLIDWFMVSFI